MLISSLGVLTRNKEFGIPLPLGVTMLLRFMPLSAPLSPSSIYCVQAFKMFTY